MMQVPRFATVLAIVHMNCATPSSEIDMVGLDEVAWIHQVAQPETHYRSSSGSHGVEHRHAASNASSRENPDQPNGTERPAHKTGSAERETGEMGSSDHEISTADGSNQKTSKTGKVENSKQAASLRSARVRNSDDSENLQALLGASRTYARRIAVVIGIDQYKGSVSSLGSARSDAEKMAALLRDFGFESVFELYDADAKRRDIVQILTDRLPEKLGPNDLLVVYFAGHGGADPVSGRSYLLPQDATWGNLRDTGLTMQALKETALALNVRSVLFLVDACFSGTIIRPESALGQKIDDEYWREARRGRVVQIITAGTGDESALEAKRGKRSGGGIFTDALRAGLQYQADRNKDFVITTTELGQYVVQAVPEKSNHRQNPDWGTVEGSGEVMIYDVRDIPKDLRHTIPLIPRERIPRRMRELATVHRMMDEMRWVDAEEKLRAMLLQEPDPELNLLLAEVYLEISAHQQRAFKNRTLIERELLEAERGRLSNNQKRRAGAIRQKMRKMVRGGY